MPARLTLNWFSPLPPLPTDIANCTVGILAVLGARADVTAWSTQAEWPDAPIPGVTWQRFSDTRPPAPERLNEADLNVFNIGNNAQFHRAIFEVARRNPGLMILHDTRLQHFFAAYSEQAGQGRQDYLDWMERCHGPVARRRAELFVEGDLPLDRLVADYPMTEAALETGFAAVLHNRAEAEQLERRQAGPVFHLPLPFAFRPRRPRPASRKRTGPTRLVMFGFIGLNRRLEVVLEALASTGKRDAYRLDVYGKLEDEATAAAAIERLGLGSVVRLHGFVPEAELDTALHEADLVLNLRWPSMGEASGSQLRIWAAEAPALVTRTGWYEQVPAGTVFHVDPASEKRDIASHLQRVRRDPDSYAKAGVLGRRILEQQHAPERYVDGLLEIARQRAALQARLSATRLSRRSAELAFAIGGAPMVRSLRDELSERILELLADGATPRS